MRTPSSGRRLYQRPDGFTLVELLVVISIIVLITAASLPVVLPALGQRKVSEGARILHAALAGARDEAIRAGEPRGIRLLPDPQYPGPNPLAASRIVSIEPAPDYSEGRVILFTYRLGGVPVGPQVIVAAEVLAETDSNNNPIAIYPPTSWYWNVRQGDRIRFEASGSEFIVAGPMLGFTSDGTRSGDVINPDRYVNVDLPGASPYLSLPPAAPTPSGYTRVNPLSIDSSSIWGIPSQSVSPGTPPRFFLLGEYLLLVNGRDDDGDGWIDEGFDGLDNDGDGLVDPAYNGIHDGGAQQVDDPLEYFYPSAVVPNLQNRYYFEFEDESLPIGLSNGLSTPSEYIILRRPVVSERAQEVVLPPDVIIDLTSWDASGGFVPERSRLPVDPRTFSVDIMIDPRGRVVPASPAQQAWFAVYPYGHFWLTEREDVFPAEASGAPFRLPMPKALDPARFSARGLEKDRRLVSVNVRTGQITTNSIENFDINKPNLPYRDAQLGRRESP